MEKGFGFCTGAGRFWGSSGLQERQRYWYRSTGSLRISTIRYTATWSSILVLLGFLESKSQEGPIGIGTGAQVSYGFQQFLQKGGRKVSRVQVDDTSLTEYL